MFANPQSAVQTPEKVKLAGGGMGCRQHRHMPPENETPASTLIGLSDKVYVASCYRQ